MIKKTVIVFAIVIISVLILSLTFRRSTSKPYKYYKMNIEEIDNDIRMISQKNLDKEARMVYYSERFLGAPYKLNCQGDGVHARYDRLPLLNFKKVNCMTYCEIVMALTLADYYIDMFNILQHIRYRNGIIGMASRNHYTMADWLPANAWCLDDVSHKVGGADVRQITRTISHRTFFANKDINSIPVYFPDRDVTIDYIPLEQLPQHEDSLHSGDIVALIQDRPNIFSAHMLLLIKKDQQTFFRHASMSAGKVVDSPFRQYIDGLKENPRYQGMSFMRLKDTIQWQDCSSSHGKFIIP